MSRNSCVFFKICFLFLFVFLFPVCKVGRPGRRAASLVGRSAKSVGWPLFVVGAAVGVGAEVGTAVGVGVGVGAAVGVGVGLVGAVDVVGASEEAWASGMRVGASVGASVGALVGAVMEALVNT